LILDQLVPFVFLPSIYHNCDAQLKLLCSVLVCTHCIHKRTLAEKTDLIGFDFNTRRKQKTIFLGVQQHDTSHHSLSPPLSFYQNILEDITPNRVAVHLELLVLKLLTEDRKKKHQLSTLQHVHCVYFFLLFVYINTKHYNRKKSNPTHHTNTY
jgi:hypothetical protein